MRRLILILVCALTAALGWHLGRMRTAPVLAQKLPDPGATALARLPSDSVPKAGDSKPIFSEETDALLSTVTNSIQFAEIGPQVLDFAKTLSSADFPSAIAAAGTSKNRYAGRLAGLLAGYWAEVDLDAAKAWMFSLGSQTLSAEIVNTWARQRPAEMLGWFESLSGEEKRRRFEMLVSVIAYTAGYHDPARAARILAEAPRRDAGTVDYNSNAAYINALFERWTNRAPQAAAEVALSMPSGDGRTTAVMGVVREWTKSNPAAARAWMEALPDATLAMRATPVHGAALTAADPRGAAMYLVSQQQSPENTKTLQRASAAWASRDFDAALAWSRTLSDQESVRAVCSGLITSLVQADVDRTARTINSASWDQLATVVSLAEHSTSRREFLKVLSRQKNTSGAQLWIKGTSFLSQQEKAQILATGK